MVQTCLVQHKICLLGDRGVGKTSLVRRFVEGKFEQNYGGTVGVTITHKLSQCHSLTLDQVVWDLNDSSNFDSLLSSYCQGASAAIIVADLGQFTSLGKMDYYTQHFLRLHPHSKVVLVGNKVDLKHSDWQIQPVHLLQLAEKYNNAPVFLTSAKTGMDVAQIFVKLAQLLVVKS